MKIFKPIDDDDEPGYGIVVFTISKTSLSLFLFITIEACWKSK